MISVAFSYALDWSVVPHSGRFLAAGIVLSMQIAVLALAWSVALGLLVALARMSGVRPLSGLAYLYIDFCRSLSVYIYVLFIYFGLAAAFRLRLSPLSAAVAALTLQNSAYIAEIYRSAIDAIDPGQREAAKSLGMGSVGIFAVIVLPQALRIAVPSLVNQFVAMIKDSAVVASVGANDLMHETVRAVQFENRPFELYTAAAAIYLAWVLAVSGLASLLERRLSRYLR